MPKPSGDLHIEVVLLPKGLSPAAARDAFDAEWARWVEWAMATLDDEEGAPHAQT